jgi:hypothetical protein
VAAHQRRAKRRGRGEEEGKRKNGGGGGHSGSYPLRTAVVKNRGRTLSNWRRDTNMEFEIQSVAHAGSNKFSM